MRDGDKEKIDGLLSQLSDYEAEISLLRRRIQSLEDECGRLKKENVRLQSELQKARTVSAKLGFYASILFDVSLCIQDLDQETLNRIDYQNQVQTLLEEIEFIRRVHDQVSPSTFQVPQA